MLHARYMLDTKPRYMLHATIRPKPRYSYKLRAGKPTNEGSVILEWVTQNQFHKS